MLFRSGLENNWQIIAFVMAAIMFFCILALAICIFFMNKLLRFLKRRTIDKNVLLLEYTSDSYFNDRIVRALCNSGAEKCSISRKSDIHKKYYDVVIIFNALAQKPQLLMEARKYLCDGGAIIALAYTSHRKNVNKKSKLISTKEYVGRLKERGCNITCCFCNRLVGITYFEISNQWDDK